MSRRGPKVLVAMSGGVDSSVAAALLVRAGYDVVGLFMRLGSPGERLDEPIADECNARDRPGVEIIHRGCCSVGDAADARLVAAELGIPFYVCNFRPQFSRIIDHFVDEYARGRTPNPCVRCNDWLKFGRLYDHARQLGADCVATGHYARVDRSRLLRAIDQAKDQSYVLFGIPRDRLDSILLPVGEHHKHEIRRMARRFGLPVFDKPDSQEICFVPDNDYAALLERRRPDLAREGDVLDTDGRVVGRHKGQHRFTFGQRRGVGLALGRPIYVVDKDPAANTITVGPREQLKSASCTAGEANWFVDPSDPGTWRACMAQYRAHGQPISARFRLASKSSTPTPSGRRGMFEVCFDEPQIAVAPGQAIVLYDADDPAIVLGGGWITRSIRADAAASAIPVLKQVARMNAESPEIDAENAKRRS